jgi:hypothetical protein
MSDSIYVVHVNIHEIVTPQRRWSLRGSVVTPAHRLLTGNSLQIVRPSGILSSSILSAMLRRSILPNVEINTPKDKITLVNARIVSIKPTWQSQTISHHSEPSSYESENVCFTFNKILIENLFASTSPTDDWT